MIAVAKEFAEKAHAGQRYKDKPYTYHLEQVAKILEPYGTIAVVCGWLHDVLEDTSTTPENLDREFGSTILRCVRAVTDETPGPRSVRKRASNEKLAKLDWHLPLIVKAADRLANLREGGKRDMYRREHAAFKRAAYRPGVCDELWEEMDRILAESEGDE